MQLDWWWPRWAFGMLRGVLAEHTLKNPHRMIFYFEWLGAINYLTNDRFPALKNHWKKMFGQILSPNFPFHFETSNRKRRISFSSWALVVFLIRCWTVSVPNRELFGGVIDCRLWCISVIHQKDTHRTWVEHICSLSSKKNSILWNPELNINLQVVLAYF